jgi:hypothetical protein
MLSFTRKLTDVLRHTPSVRRLRRTVPLERGLRMDREHFLVGCPDTSIVFLWMPRAHNLVVTS